MKRFFVGALIFIFLQIILACLLLFVAELRFSYSSNTSEAMLPIIPKNKNFDVVILGSSHARVFTTGLAEKQTTKILGKSYLNLGKTAAGIVPEKIYLKYFFSRENSTKNIVYFLDPFVFYDNRWNEFSQFAEDEPLNLTLLKLMVNNRLDSSVVYNYIRSKFTPYWILFRGNNISNESNALNSVDDQAVAKRLSVLYPSQVTSSTFYNYVGDFNEIINLAKTQNSKLHIIIPPTLFRHDPGLAIVKEYLESLKKNEKISYADFSNVITGPQLYQDHDHLNLNGMREFLQKYLLPQMKYEK